MSVAVTLKKKPVARKTLFSLLAKALSANPKFGGKFRTKDFHFNEGSIRYDDSEDENILNWSGFDFYCNDEFPFCCGLAVIGEFDNVSTGDTAVDAILLRIQLAIIKDNFITATVVQRNQPNAYNMLIAAGFKVMAVWKNVNTGHKITMFGWNRATAKALPIS